MIGLLKILGFLPKENSSDVFIKKYQNHEDYFIEIDFQDESINYGKKINSGRKTTQNFKDYENWVVLECVDRLLEKGYKPEDIILEQKFTVGHGASGGWLDILVKKDNKTFLMIECKTWGKEFEKEFKNLEKKGGQLFTYFQNDKNADFLVLYTSKFNEKNNKIEYKNEIVKIKTLHKDSANVKEFFENWNKKTEKNGIFEFTALPYVGKSSAILNFMGEGGLKDIHPEDSGPIFNQFLEILRHNVVSDKPNAFNKIFNLFLCKIIDEAKTLPNQPLKFQWFATPQVIEEINIITGEKEKKHYPADDNVTFQKRLTELYTLGMKEFLKKEVQAFGEEKMRNLLGVNIDKQQADKIIYNIVADFLKKNNEFAIKEVFDTETFEDNAIAVKEIVELLSTYRIRYPRKQQHLSDFFERLLTTGLKQESGQFFTPVPIARFICKSVPLKKEVDKKLKTKGELPNVIDYAVGSGHFLTESMEEIQTHIDSFDENNVFGHNKQKLDSYKVDKFGWAMNHIYGIEKDYRLVKVSKVGCYFYGDGLANVIHGDGLDSFEKSKTYRGLLSKYKESKPTENEKFDFVLSNPPYSVSGFISDIQQKTNAEFDFDLYKNLTYQSSEIEVLFIERTKQLLPEGGIAALVLPASILSNSGIYTKAREIILKNFEIISIVELGSNTFMATGTSTVILFLKKRKEEVLQKIETSIDIFFQTQKDSSVRVKEDKVEENIFSKYISHIFEEEDENNKITFEDYQSLIAGYPNENIKRSEFFVEYTKKLSSKIYKTEKSKIQKILEKEKEKLLYFILAYPQEVILVNSGEKKEEKNFLGYEFSNRRGDEGLHAINRSKSVDECTKLYDDKSFYNPQKASTYILESFENKPKREISENLKKNISRVDLVDMLTFDRVEFEKTVSTSVKKKIKIESQWDILRIGDICETSSGGTPKSGVSDYYENGHILWINSGEVRNGFILSSENKITDLGLEKSSAKIFPKNTVLVAMYGATTGQVGILGVEASTNQAVCGILPNKNINYNYLYRYLDTQLENFISLSYGVARSNISQEVIKNFKIPLPPLDIQQKIVDECEKVDSDVKNAEEKIEEGKKEIERKINLDGHTKNLRSFLKEINPSKSNIIRDLDLDLPVSFLSMSDVSNQGIIMNLQERELGEVKTGYTFFQEDDVLFAKITPCMENGKGALIRKLKNNIGFGSTEFFVLRVNKTLLLPEILFYILNSKKLRIEAEKNMTGASGHRRVPQKFLESYKIPILTLKTQQKIVSEIEKIEEEISENQKIIDEAGNTKEEILKRYL
jgi:type I restriction enzyme M protein